jgi:hypothetical protein
MHGHAGMRQYLFQLNIVGFQGQAGFAGQDEQFAAHIGPGEVVAGVGLGEPASFGVFYDVGKTNTCFEIIENKRQGSGEDAFNFDDPVARVNEIVEGGDNGEPAPTLVS